mgnify:CR=1 FL=1
MNNMEKLGKFVFYTLIISVDIVIKSFVFMKMWVWFIVPAFKVPSLSLVYCTGIIIFIYYMRISSKEKDKETDLNTSIVAEMLLRTIVFAALYLLVGFLIYKLQ